jgi:hypothetical protein
MARWLDERNAILADRRKSVGAVGIEPRRLLCKLLFSQRIFLPVSSAQYVAQ